MRIIFVVAVFSIHVFGAWFNLSATYPSVYTAADSISNADYFRKHSTTSLIVNVSLSFLSGRNFYWGFRYEYWSSDRKFDLGGSSFNERLNYQTVGLDLGWENLTARVWWAFVGGVHYPLIAYAGAYSGSRMLQYQGRGVLNIRLKGSLWLSFELGYRLANLGLWTNGVTSYTEGAVDFSLSGPFVTFGFAFQL